jgi:hypothetical protein
MTNKGKVLTALIVAVIVLAGGTTLYFKGGDLMGKVFRMKTPDVPKVTVCPSGTDAVVLYGNVPVLDNLYQDFDSFFNAVLTVKNSNNNQLDCPYRFTFHSGLNDDNLTTVLYCEKDEVVLKDQNGIKSVKCFKTMNGILIGGEVQQAVGDVGAHVEFSYETDQGSVIQTETPYYYDVAKIGKIY